MTLRERWERHVLRGEGCWLWQARVDRDGYGRIGNAMAHRVAVELFSGPIPSGMQVDHVCRVKSCVNPAHLRIVTPLVNVMENSNGIGALNAKKVACPRCGTAFRFKANRSRECRPCQRTADARWKKAHPAATLATKKRWRDKVPRSQRS